MATKYLKTPNESPYGGERLLQPKKQFGDELDKLTGKDKVYDKQAKDAKENRKEAEAEGVKFAKGGKIDGCAQRGKTRGKMV